MTTFPDQHAREFKRILDRLGVPPGVSPEHQADHVIGWVGRTSEAAAKAIATEARLRAQLAESTRKMGRVHIAAGCTEGFRELLAHIEAQSAVYNQRLTTGLHDRLVTEAEARRQLRDKIETVEAERETVEARYTAMLDRALAAESAIADLTAEAAAVDARYVERAKALIASQEASEAKVCELRTAAGIKSYFHHGNAVERMTRQRERSNLTAAILDAAGIIGDWGTDRTVEYMRKQRILANKSEELTGRLNELLRQLDKTMARARATAGMGHVASMDAVWLRLSQAMGVWNECECDDLRADLDDCEEHHKILCDAANVPRSSSWEGAIAAAGAGVQAAADAHHRGDTITMATLTTETALRATVENKLRELRTAARIDYRLNHSQALDYLKNADNLRARRMEPIELLRAAVGVAAHAHEDHVFKTAIAQLEAATSCDFDTPLHHLGRTAATMVGASEGSEWSHVETVLIQKLVQAAEDRGFREGSE